MSVSGVSAAPINSYQTPQSSLQQGFWALVSSLNSGDLTGAQQAYASLTNPQSNEPSANPNSPFAQALSQIGAALQNGDLSGAQQALSELQQARGGHHHHGHFGGGERTPTTTASTTSSSSSTPPALTTSGTINITA